MRFSVVTRWQVLCQKFAKEEGQTRSLVQQWLDLAVQMGSISEMRSLRFALLWLPAILTSYAELFVSSHDSSQIYRFTETNLDFIDVFVPNTNGRLQAPHGIAFGLDGNLY